MAITPDRIIFSGEGSVGGLGVKFAFFEHDGMRVSSEDFNTEDTAPGVSQCRNFAVTPKLYLCVRS